MELTGSDGDPPFFSVLRRKTGFSDKQLSDALRSLSRQGSYPILRWIDLGVEGRLAAISAPARDTGSIRLPPGSRGRSWAIDLLCKLRDDGAIPVEALSPLAVRRYRQLKREGAVRFRTQEARTGRRGRPSHVVFVELSLREGDSSG